MAEAGKVTASHRCRHAIVDIRQSTMTQVDAQRESTERHYALVDHAQPLGWRSDQITVIDEQGVVRKRVRRLPRDEWAVFIRDHHEGFIDWPTFEANQARIATNTRPGPYQAGGAVLKVEPCSRA